MKRNLLLTFCTAIFGLAVFTSCGSDDDEEIFTPPETENPSDNDSISGGEVTPGEDTLPTDSPDISYPSVTPMYYDATGNYNGNLEVMGSTVSAVVVVESAGNKTVMITLNDFNFMGVEVGDVVAECLLIPEVSSENYVSFAGATAVNVLGADIPVQVEGSAENESISMTISFYMTPETPMTAGYKGIR